MNSGQYSRIRAANAARIRAIGWLRKPKTTGSLRKCADSEVAEAVGDDLLEPPVHSTDEYV